MPQPWNRERLASAISLLLELLATVELEDEVADEVCEALLAKLWQRSGMDAIAFHAAVTTASQARCE